MARPIPYGAHSSMADTRFVCQPRFDPYFHWQLIAEDPDDNKFVDCAFAANATYIVSNDTHFDVLRDITFPKLLVLKLNEFLESLQNKNTAFL